MERSVIPCLTFILFLIKRTKSELYIKRGISCVYKLFENGRIVLNKKRKAQAVILADLLSIKIGNLD